MIVIMKLTAEQAYTIEDALELYSRINMGQFDQVEYMLQMDTFDQAMKRPKYDRELAKQYLESARRTIFTSEVNGAYTGIQMTSERSKISWDIYQQLRHDISHFKYPYEPLESRGRSFDRPFITSKEPLPEITITEE